MVKLAEIRQSYKELYQNIRDIDLIIMDTLNIDKSKLFLDIYVSARDEHTIKEKAARLINGEPVEYITGHKEFMSLDFYVDSSTLIPRADTEILVEKILSIYKDKSPYIFEIGTGSGCIAISLAHYLPDSNIIACDISEKALNVARINAKSNNVDAKIKFINHDILKGFPKLPKLPDCIVSNPPYIESGVIGTLDKSVKDFEPISALDGGIDGLMFYRQIISENPLKNGGILAFEVGYNQGNSVANLLEKDYIDIEIIKDLGKNDRVVLGVKRL